MESTQAIPRLLEAARASSKSWQSGQYDADFQRASREQLGPEREALKKDPAFAKELVQIVYGESVRANASFYDPLVQFAEHLNFGDEAKEVIGIVWAEASTRLDATQIETVLVELPSVTQYFGLMLESLPHMVRRQDLSAKTLIRVSEVIAKHIEDKFGPGLDRALEAFAERQPSEAIKVLSEVARTDNNFWILGLLLGRLRIGPHAVSLANTITQFENRFKGSPYFLDRHLFYRSWFQEAFSGQLTVANVDQLCALADAHGETDVHAVIVLFAIWMSTPKLSPTVFRRAFEWLAKHVSPTISDVGKLQVAQFASFYKSNQYQWPDDWRPNLSPLVIAILPIAAEHLGIWDKIDFYLASLLPTDAATFQTVVREVVVRSGTTFLTVLKKRPGMGQMLNQMRMVPQDDLIGELCICPDRTQRLIGLFLFDKLHVKELPVAALTACDPRICWILLHEVAVVASHLVKESAGRCLLSLLSQVDRIGEEFTAALKEELLVQAQNYPGACGKMFEEKAADNRILQEVMADQDKYFKALAETKNSPVLQMQVQGYHRAMEEFFRNFSNEVQQGARQHSVLMQMVHEVAILYGLSWSTFHGNQLGEPTNLQRISHGTELPRLEIIAPEDMQMRRLHALTQIQTLEADIKEHP